MEGGKPRPEEWGERYGATRPLYVEYTGAVEQLLRQLLNDASISYSQIEGRAKDIPNFVTKLRRKDSKYEDPLREVTDLAGVRVILYYLDDVERVGRLIEEQFAVDAKNSVDKSAALDPDRFGYLSVHHVVRLSASRLSLPEWKRYGDLCVEVQVRTVLQHAWAAISRQLTYASVREAPRDLQRNLNRLSALLELADDEFRDIRSVREAIEEQYDVEVERGNLDLDVDESSLGVYLRESGFGDRISALAREAGSPTVATKGAAYGEDEEEIESERAREYRDLLAVLERTGYERIADLDEMLKRVWKFIPGFMREFNQRYVDERDGLPFDDDPYGWLSLIALWLEGASAETFGELHYVPEIAEIVTAIATPG